jgi:CheY-like chemotaxis protein
LLEASDAQRTVEIIERNSDTDLVLLDLNRPDRDGLALLGKLHAPSDHIRRGAVGVSAPAVRLKEAICPDAARRGRRKARHSQFSSEMAGRVVLISNILHRDQHLE